MTADRKGLRPILVGSAAACLAVVIAAQPAVPAGPGGKPSSANASKRDKEPELPIVRLNFVSTPWQQVLEHLAEETKSTLVMHDVPAGRFSRRDLRRHTRTEAVQILNQQLEPLGFRILEKDKFLTVIETQRARVEYQRHNVRSDGAEVPADGAPAVEPSAVPAASASPNTRSAERAIKAGAAPPSIHQAGYQEADVEPTTDQPAAQSATEDPAAMQVVTVRTTRPVTDVARQLYAAFGERAELMPTEGDKLPSFRVSREPPVEAGGPARDTWFVLEMDSATNELHIHAPAQTAAGVAELIRRLDSNPPREGEELRLVPDAEQAGSIAEQLNNEMAELRRRRRGQPENPFAAQPSETGAELGIQPLPDDAAEGTAPDVLGNLRGDVSVDALADLDLLILRGNERDIEAVMAVIDKIEEMAIGATPGIALHFLNNVDSEALAALLNDVYTRLTTLSTGTAASARQSRAVNVVAVGSPNAILVLAPQNTLEDVLDLAEQLDQAQPSGTEVEVFFLRNAVASQVVTMLEGFYEERPGLGTNIRVIADARTNSVIVNASPKELAEVTKVIREIDSKQPRATAQVQVVPLQNALADELAEFLNSVIQGVLNPAQTGAGQQLAAAAGTGTNQALRDAKSMVLEFLTTDGAAQRIIRSGVLSDIRVTADVRSNTLTVTAPAASMPLLLELITVLDRPTTAIADIKAFTLTRADATSAAELLESLFPVTEDGQPGTQLAGAEGFGSALIPLRVSVDTRTNTVVVVGSTEVLGMVQAILFRIDQDAARNRRIEVLRLKNSPASDVALAINQFLQSQRELLNFDPDRISTSEILEQEVIVTPEPISNNLIISATPDYFEKILNLAKELDREPPQVMISALIVEVTLEDTDEFGIELGFQDSVLFDRSLAEAPVTVTETTTLPTGVATTTQRIISQAAVPGFLFNNVPLGNNVGVNTGQVGKQSLTNFGVGRVNDDLGFGGLVLSASSESVSVLLRALAAHRHVQILSNPQVLALDNQLAQIQQGQQVPIVNGVTLGTTGLANPQIEQQDSGIILTVTPRISTDGQIVMEVIAEKSQFDLNNGVPVFTDASTGNVITSPVKDITTAITSAKVQDGQTVVIGGLITKTEDVLESKVPYLGDIPILGAAFRFDSRVFRRTELLIFLTPRIVHGDVDVELIKQVEMERMHFFEDEAEMIHGPLMGVPPEEIFPETYFDEQGATILMPDMSLPGTAEPMLLGPTEEPARPSSEPEPMILGPTELTPTPSANPSSPTLPEPAPGEPPTVIEPRRSIFGLPRMLKR